MKPSAMFDLSIRHKPWRSGHLRWVMQDLAGVARQSEHNHRAHLRGALQDPSWRERAWHAMAWIKRNQRVTGSALCDALPDAVPIWGGAAAFKFTSDAAKHFALMMDMVGIPIPLDGQEKNT